MAIEKITSADMTGKKISELADVPNLSSSSLKSRFDSLSVDLLVPKVNEVIENVNQSAEGSIDSISVNGTEQTITDHNVDITVPTKTSDLTNDSNFITTETDPTVPSWAKATTKPSYTAAEVGALPSTTVIPTKLSDLTDDLGSTPVHTHSQYLTEHQSLDGYATQTWVEGKGYVTDISGKADKATTLAGYGITDGATTTQLNDKADATEVQSLKSDLSDLQMLGYEIPKSFSPHNSATETTFTQKSARLCLGDLTWTKQAVSEYSSYQFYSSVIPNITLPTNNSTPANIYCYEYKTTSVPKTVLFASDNNIGLDTNGKLWLHSEAIASKTIDEVQSLLKNVYLYYQLLTPITKKIDGNEDNSQIKKSLSDAEANGFYSPNLVEPILATSQANGGTCTNNGDGTYTISGTFSASKTWALTSIVSLENGTYRLCGSNNSGISVICNNHSDNANIGKSQNSDVNINITDGGYRMYLSVSAGTYSNVIVKPMLTKNTSLTYNDYVQYVPSNSTIKTALSQKGIVHYEEFNLSTTAITKTISESYQYIVVGVKDVNWSNTVWEIIPKNTTATTRILMCYCNAASEWQRVRIDIGSNAVTFSIYNATSYQSTYPNRITMMAIN